MCTRASALNKLAVEFRAATIADPAPLALSVSAEEGDAFALFFAVINGQDREQYADAAPPYRPHGAYGVWRAISMPDAQPTWTWGVDFLVAPKGGADRPSTSGPLFGGISLGSPERLEEISSDQVVRSQLFELDQTADSTSEIVNLVYTDPDPVLLEDGSCLVYVGAGRTKYEREDCANGTAPSTKAPYEVFMSDNPGRSLLATWMDR